MEIKTKRDWYEYQNLFNTMPSYTPTEFLHLHYYDHFWGSQLFGVRNLEQAGGAFFAGNAQDVEQFFRGQMHQRSKYRIYERAPDDAIILQGEYDGENARLSKAKTIMRLIKQEDWFHTTRAGLLALVGLEMFNQLEDILAIFHKEGSSWTQDSHVVEFSSYSRGVGIYNEPLIIWEVRRY